MGETVDDRIDMLVTLANLPVPQESVPINMLIPMPGSKLADAAPVDPIEFVQSSHSRASSCRNRTCA